MASEVSDIQEGEMRMRRRGTRVLLALLAVTLCIGVSGCWGKKASRKGKDIEAILRTCPPVDIVYIMDTSGSMDSISTEVCAKITGVNAELIARGLQDIQSNVYGITDTGFGTAFDCLEDDVVNLFGSAVPGSPNPGDENLNNSEDWGPGGAVIADRFPWRPNSLRILVPISDEGAENGGTGSDMIDADDSAAMQNLIDVALANGVVVSPMWGSGDHRSEDQDPVFIDALDNIANATGGSVTLNPAALGSLDDALFNLIVAACETYEPPTGSGTSNGSGTGTGDIETAPQ